MTRYTLSVLAIYGCVPLITVGLLVLVWEWIA